MAEIFALCDRVTVFRDGHHMSTDKVSEMTPELVVRRMVGREISRIYPPKLEGAPGKTLLSVEKLSDGDRFTDISFELREGEILGLGGLIGAGRSEIALGLCGLRPVTGGSVVLDGKPVTIRDYPSAVRRGLTYLSEDRKSSGVFLDMSIAANISVLDLKQVTRGILLDRKAEARQALDLTQKMGVRMGGIYDPVSSLSGGNQQKVAIAKQLSVSPRIIIMDEPTRGIDVGAKTEIHKLLRELAASGVGVIVISSELPELIGVCDRVVVIREGRVAGELSGDITEEAVIRLASGVTNKGELADVA